MYAMYTYSANLYNVCAFFIYCTSRVYIVLAVSWIITAICEGFDDNEYMYDNRARMRKCTAEIMEFPKTYNTWKPVQTGAHNQSRQETERWT